MTNAEGIQSGVLTWDPWEQLVLPISARTIKLMSHNVGKELLLLLFDSFRISLFS